MKYLNNEVIMKAVLTEQKSSPFMIHLVGSILAAVIFLFLSLSIQAQPYLKASQNLVLIPNGQTVGQVTLTWDGGNDHQYAEIWQQIDNNQETFVVEQGKGTRQMTVEVGKTYIFKLSDFGKLLDSVKVTAKYESSDKPSSTNGGVVTRPKPGNDFVNLITDLKTESKSSSVVINFWSLPNASPTVEIGTTPPVQSFDRWIFPAGQSVGQGKAIASQKNGPLSKKVGVKANTLHRFDSLTSGFAPLEPGTTYWYLITGQNPTGQPNFFQTTGSFTTGSQTVKVVFDKIYIIDDSDDLSGADLTYWLWINHGHSTQTGFARGEATMFTGSTYDIKKEFVIQNAPQTLSLSVSAIDDDDPFRGGSPATHVPSPLRSYQNAGRFDENVAKLEWDLRLFPTAPGETFRQEFTLTSMDGGELQFEVYGYWEITRSN